MAVAQIGTTLSIGAGTITGSYIVESRVDGEKEVVYEDIDDENGELETRIVFKKLPQVTLNLICISGAAPATDFAQGAKATHTDFTAYFVDTASITRTKSAQRVTVKMTNIGI